MLEAKVAGEEIVAPEPQEEGAPVIDLLEALKQSVAQAGKREATEKKPAARKKAASGGRKRASARS
jgi:DNA end-binding protein Ku